MKKRSNNKNNRLMVVTSGWYGLGHMTPVSTIIEELRKISDVHISLFTLPFEVSRLERRRQDHLFDAVYVGAEGDATDYQEYVIHHYYENRIRFHHAFHQEQPDLLLFHWMMLIEMIDVACLSQCYVVALLEETEWSNVVPGSSKSRHFSFVDEVIFCDNINRGRDGLKSRQHRVGCITNFAAVPPLVTDAKTIATHYRLPIGLPLILINTAGGSYRRTHRYIQQLLSLVERRSDLAFLIMIGPMFPNDLRSQVQAKIQRLANLAIVSDPPREEIECLVKAADLSVNSGGISSTAECLAMRKKFLVVNPVGSEHENDACRVQRLVQEGLCLLIETNEEDNGDTLSHAIDKALASTPPLERVPSDGAVQVAHMLKERFDAPLQKAVSDESAIVCFYAPDVHNSVRQKVHKICPSDWHYFAIDLPYSSLDCSLSLDLEVDRAHRLLASLSSYKEVLLVAVIGQNPDYDQLLHLLQLSREILVVSIRPPVLKSRFLSELEGDPLPYFIREIRKLLGNGGRFYRIRPPAPEYENYVEIGFSPFRMVR